MYGGDKKPKKIKIQEQSEDNIIKSINLFRLKTENEAIKGF